MSQLRKLIKFFLSRPTEVRFEDVKRLLTAFGFEEIRSKGSHHSFRNSQGSKITIPKKSGQKVKATYVEEIINLLSLDEWNEEESEEDSTTKE